MILSAALDLGTTRIKGALLNEKGELSNFVSVAAPPITGAGLKRESSPSSYAEKAEKVVQELYKKTPNSIPLGIATQRSSFLLWEKETSRPITPLISWMDRRAFKWIGENMSLREKFTENTGLPFSPHFAGPKLASLLSEQPELKKKANGGGILFGTIECYLLWLWSKGTVHCTDISMASRTLMCDFNTGDWAEEKLALYGISRTILPEITTTGTSSFELPEGLEIKAIPADQPSAFYASSHLHPKNTSVNLGTGGFILSLSQKRDCTKEGILYTPLYLKGKKGVSVGMEGTINGLTSSIRATGGSSQKISRRFFPKTYCIPDSNGVGSPHWNPSLSLLFSPECSKLTNAERRVVLFEGIIFRVVEIIEALNTGAEAVSLSGGLARNQFFKKGLATCLNKRVQVLSTPEGSLLGASLMAAGNSKPDLPKPTVVFPSKNASLRRKYSHWKEWLKTVLESG